MLDESLRIDIPEESRSTHVETEYGLRRLLADLVALAKECGIVPDRGDTDRPTEFRMDPKLQDFIVLLRRPSNAAALAPTMADHERVGAVPSLPHFAADLPPPDHKRSMIALMVAEPDLSQAHAEALEDRSCPL